MKFTENEIIDFIKIIFAILLALFIYWFCFGTSPSDIDKEFNNMTHEEQIRGYK
ncbi:hypothetical protein CPIN18020_0285 [Campylobacter pinnipediorum subsp. caledonicus]|uniref:hypothetical protein n=1 Tax=Campylobacter pinnipediorum TaxID=1965231 RepID=UPI0009C1F218|nr:hypothetical protein [Campylobacter pinnipediorum]AQW85529.1 hypothetical protein CPIN18020_0285 [Campylobacter pinnipediorum subsp. caledonicus]